VKADYLVSGAGTGGINGYYNIYSHDGGGHELAKKADETGWAYHNSGGNAWVLAVEDGGGSKYWVQSNNSLTIPLSGWEVLTGTAPAPTVTKP